MTEQYEVNSVATQNYGGSFMEIRLNPKRVLADIELFLSGKRKIIVTDERGQYAEVAQALGKPLANMEGINSVLQMISMRINEQVVQGNFDREQYEDNIYWTRRDLAVAIVQNCNLWGISDTKLNMIIDSIMGFLEPFMSRLIDNKERESYAQQFVSREVINQGNNKVKKNAVSNFAEGM